MADCQVTCIERTGPHGHDAISSVGNPRAQWKLTKADAVRRIEAKIDTFYVLDPITQKRADVGVVREAGKVPYLRTYADGIWTDNLLSLNVCPL
jgi:hypothetical protein